MLNFILFLNFYIINKFFGLKIFICIKKIILNLNMGYYKKNIFHSKLIGSKIISLSFNFCNICKEFVNKTITLFSQSTEAHSSFVLVNFIIKQLEKNIKIFFFYFTICLVDSFPFIM